MVLYVDDKSLKSRAKLQPNVGYLLSVCREPNGMLKIYIDGALDSGSYSGETKYAMKDGVTTFGSAGFYGAIGMLEVRDAALNYKEQQELCNGLKARRY